MKKANIPTLIAISIISWIMVNMFHEIAGHAGFGLLAGLDLKAVNTTTSYFDVNWNIEIDQNGFFGYRITLCGGVLLNFITGLIAWFILKYAKGINSQMRLFLWLFASFSYIIIVMNLVTAPFTGGGDFAGIIKTYDAQGTIGIVILIIGIIIMVLGYIFLQKSFMPKLKKHRSILLSITVIPVATLMIIQTLSLIWSPFAYLPPAQNHLLASVFAYFHFFIWAFIVNIIPTSSNSNLIESVLPNKSIMWIIISAILLIFYIFSLGPGLGSFNGHPSLLN